ncbi:MAG: hypothetical protein ACU84Q_00700 [Gammaproteobacteria bacterium]
MTINSKTTLTLSAGLFVSAWTLFCYLSVRDNTVGLLSDSYIYLLLADHYSPLHHLDGGFAEYLLGKYAYPPGFPILLGWLGGGSQFTITNYIVDAAFLAATVAVFFIWLVAQGLSQVKAFSVTVIFSLLPGTLLSSLGIFSEHPYMLALLIAATLLTKPVTPKRLILAAIFIGFAALIRSVGVSAIFAFALMCLSQMWGSKLARRTSALAFALALLPISAWSLVRKVNGYASNYTDSIVGGDYRETLLGIVAQLPINLRAFWHHFNLLITDLNIATSVVTGLVLIVIVVGWLAAFRRFRFEAIYVAGYFVIIFAWPYPNHFGRFITAVLPLLLYYGYVGSSELMRFSPWQTKPGSAGSIATLGYLLTLVVLALPSSAQFITEIVSAHDGRYKQIVRTPNWHLLSGHKDPTKILALTKMLKKMHVISDLTPKDACVSSSEPHFIHFYAQRRSRKPAPASVDDTGFNESLIDCPYVFMMAVSSVPPSEYPAMYPFHRIRRTMQVLDVSFFETDVKKGTVSTMLATVAEARSASPKQSPVKR